MRKISSILLFICLMCMSATINTYAQADAPAGIAVGTAAPEISLSTLQGQTIKLSDYRGKYVVVDFWASWCPDCIRELPAMKKIFDEYNKKDVVFIGVSFDDKPERLTACIEKYQISWPQISEMKKWKDTVVSKDYGVKWIPSMYLIDPSGNVAYFTVNAKDLETKLQELIH